MWWSDLACALLRDPCMRERIVIIAALLVGLVRGAAAGERCWIEERWDGSPVRIVDAAVSGDRVLVALGGSFVVFDRAGRRVAGRDDDRPAGLEQVVATAGGFFDVRSDGLSIVVDRLGLDAGVRESIALQRGTPDVMNGASVDVSDGVLAVAWTVPQGQFASAFDAHLALIRPDGATITAEVLPARAGAFWASPAFARDVVWMLWREDPNLRLVGVRFSTADGHRLDAEPVAIGREYNTFVTERFGDFVRLYAESTRGTTDVFDLAPDGTVAPRGPAAAHAGRALPLPGGDVVRVSYAGTELDEFPGDGVATVVRQAIEGERTELARLERIAQVVPALAGDELWLLTAEDAVRGEYATSVLRLRRLSLAGAPLASADLIRNERRWVEEEVCEYEPAVEDLTGCSAGRNAGGGAALLVVALLVRRRRRR